MYREAARGGHTKININLLLLEKMGRENIKCILTWTGEPSPRPKKKRRRRDFGNDVEGHKKITSTIHLRDQSMPQYWGSYCCTTKHIVLYD